MRLQNKRNNLLPWHISIMTSIHFFNPRIKDQKTISCIKQPLGTQTRLIKINANPMS